MAEVRGWWAGAVRRPWLELGTWFRSLPLTGAQLESLRADGLRRHGVPPELVARWSAAEPVVTRGMAVRICDPGYPDGLRALPDAPAVLFVEGQADVLGRRMVGVVGTRRCSTAGAQLAFQVGRTLADAGLTVVSGLAHGIDAAAHHGALQTGSTVAVIGHGLATTSPAAHRPLRAQIARSGAVVTAFPDDLLPDRWTFPRRNRWLAGLCEAVVVVEAPSESGAMLTALGASELGRRLFAFPGPAGSPLHAGVHDLLRSHEAHLVDSPEELRDLLVPREASPRPAWEQALFRGEALEIVARLRGVTTLELLADLGRLEILGAVVRLPGQRYVEGKGAM